MPYLLQAPLEQREPARDWVPDLVQWWERLGSAIGNDVEPMRPGADSAIRARAVRIRPAIVRLITPRELNIVLERLTLADADRFDLIIVTNVLVYYGRFEQALALANIASMLRPGGYLLTNYVASGSESLGSAAALSIPVRVDRQGNGDTMLWYQRASQP
jgi:SAM-dependent methyltransferase